ncbi:hypothetical protein KUCAC02_000629 [Chaenocephalus aceratus]|uniref:Uncharacterized protein n=1 Tax=Chaenocephalus aceratus TaxID=36190 RepID=A0ACB9W635_CHAAC|nr:hypothetical protein KUCAC02_000629 [Chaenocephalus aceratus]
MLSISKCLERRSIPFLQTESAENVNGTPRYTKFWTASGVTRLLVFCGKRGAVEGALPQRKHRLCVCELNTELYWDLEQRGGKRRRPCGPHACSSSPASLHQPLSHCLPLSPVAPAFPHIATQVFLIGCRLFAADVLHRDSLQAMDHW